MQVGIFLYITLGFVDALSRENVSTILKSVYSVHIFECALESTYDVVVRI